jgi:putative (di)nucleoside polyphosphate hydrolase
MSDIKDLPYRPCAGVMLVNRAGKVFVGQRIDTILEAWQMPQGGIDPGEDAYAAAVRELGEETGITPDNMVGKVWKGKWRGQRQRWFLFRFLGEDGDVRIDTAHPEFRAWRWSDPDDLPRLIVPFKRGLYEAVLAAFRPRLGADQTG